MTDKLSLLAIRYQEEKLTSRERDRTFKNIMKLLAPMFSDYVSNRKLIYYLDGDDLNQEFLMLILKKLNTWSRKAKFSTYVYYSMRDAVRATHKKSFMFLQGVEVVSLTPNGGGDQSADIYTARDNEYMWERMSWLLGYYINRQKMINKRKKI